jgi:DNA polymerase-3 subunit alpha
LRNNHSNKTSLFEGEDSSRKEFDFLPYTPWKQKKLLAEEFKSLGFYLSDHPLNEYKELFNQLKIIPYNQFYENSDSEAQVAGTIMSIVEKKSAKGTPYGIVKFSDMKGEFELFLFAEILVSNRDKLKESESFILTLQKDRITNDPTKKRINVKKVSSIVNVIDKPYAKVTIELKNNYNLNEISELLSANGETEINLVLKDQKKQAHYFLQNNRKFDLKHLKALKAKEYVEKITF